MRDPNTLGAVVGSLLVVSSTALASSPPIDPVSGEVVLPLQRYEELLAAVDRAEARRIEARGAVEEPVAQLERAMLRLELDESGVRASTRWTATVSGAELRPLALTTVGLVTSTRVLQPRAAVRRPSTEHLGSGRLELVASQAGTFDIEAESFLAFPPKRGSVWSFELPALEAAIRRVEIELPADLLWQAPGTTLIGERIRAGQDGVPDLRTAELAVPRDQLVRFELRRPFDQGDDLPATVRSYSATVINVQRAGVLRSDVVTFDVARGEIDRHELQLPEGLDPETVNSDEGRAANQRSGRQLTVFRERVVGGGQSRAFVLLQTPLGRVRSTPVASLRSRFDSTAHYLVVRSSVAADFGPEDDDSWLRRDSGDLPQALASVVSAPGASVWRWQGDGEPEGELRIDVLPEAEGIGAVVRRRTTTTLLTVDGTLLHRDRLQVVGRSAALELRLPAGSELWSMLVDGEPSRPLQGTNSAGEQTLFAPLSLGNDGTRHVEVVSVQSRALAPGRSRLQLDLPEVGTQVLEHQWRLLLPEGNRYRYVGGDLRLITDRDDAPQLQPGALSGRVADGSGAVLPGVEVTLRNEKGRDLQFQITDSRGWFTFADVHPGRYEVHAGLAGFGGVTYPVRLRRGRGFFVDVRLVPAVEETITVTSEAPLLDERQVQAVFEQDAKAKRENLFQQELRELEKIPTSQDPQSGRRTDREGETHYDFDQFAARSRPAAPAPPPAGRGRVAGVRPLPVDLPERGKLLQLAGVLPDGAVSVELEVRSGR